MLLPIHPGIAFCLGQMHRIRLLHPGQIPIRPLDLVNCNGIGIDNPICPALYDKIIFPAVSAITQHNLCMVTGTHLFLDHAVNSASLRHSVVRGRFFAIVNIPCAKQKLHQSSY